VDSGWARNAVTVPIGTSALTADSDDLNVCSGEILPLE
jgi:hypothetical protein